MNNGINLISSKKQNLEKQEKIVLVIRRIAYGSLITVALISTGLFMLNYLSPLPKVTIQEQQVTQSLLAQKGKIAKLLLLRDRLQHVDTIFLQNTSLEKNLTTIILNTPGDVNVNSLGVSATSVTLVFNSQSLTSINTFMDFLTEQVAKKTFFKKVTVNSLALSVKSGTYTLSIAAIPL
ncbi:MAG: hypothetical protein KGJ07_00795 [Patescibacteria group bacterium]|nr:hypothetical protein [Patescibacteria group bacterium]MDE2590133.1 hypothetical protein [Patescibacteria group bacterium]